MNTTFKGRIKPLKLWGNAVYSPAAAFIQLPVSFASVNLFRKQDEGVCPRENKHKIFLGQRKQRKARGTHRLGMVQTSRVDPRLIWIQ